MSKTGKRWAGQRKRRRIRRALNSSQEAFKALGVSRSMRLGWGAGLSGHKLTGRTRGLSDDDKQ